MAPASDLVTPDPADVVSVLAFVFCPATAFAPVTSPDEVEAVRKLMLPLKTRAIKRWARLDAKRRRS